MMEAGLLTHWLSASPPTGVTESPSKSAVLVAPVE